MNPKERSDAYDLLANKVSELQDYQLDYLVIPELERISDCYNRMLENDANEARHQYGDWEHARDAISDLIDKVSFIGAKCNASPLTFADSTLTKPEYRKEALNRISLSLNSLRSSIEEIQGLYEDLESEIETVIENTEDIESAPFRENHDNAKDEITDLENLKEIMEPYYEMIDALDTVLDNAC